MNQGDSTRGQSGQQEQQAGSQSQQTGQMNQQSGDRSGQQAQQFGGGADGNQQTGQQEAQSGGQGYGGQQDIQPEQGDNGAGQSDFGESPGGGRTSGDFGEEGLRSDQASQEEWDKESENTEPGSQTASDRSQGGFGANGE